MPGVESLPSLPLAPGSLQAVSRRCIFLVGVGLDGPARGAGQRERYAIGWLDAMHSFLRAMPEMSHLQLHINSGGAGFRLALQHLERLELQLAPALLPSCTTLVLSLVDCNATVEDLNAEDVSAVVRNTTAAAMHVQTVGLDASLPARECEISLQGGRSVAVFYS